MFRIDVELFHARCQALSISVAQLTDRAGRWGMLIAVAMFVRSISDHPITLHSSPAYKNEILFPHIFPRENKAILPSIMFLIVALNFLLLADSVALD